MRPLRGLLVRGCAPNIRCYTRAWGPCVRVGGRVTTSYKPLGPLALGAGPQREAYLSPELQKGFENWQPLWT